MLTYIGLIVAVYSTVRLGGLAARADDEEHTGRTVWYLLGMLLIVALTGLMIMDVGSGMSQMESMPY